MRTIQQTFDAVIAAGGYQDKWVPCITSSFMCNALGYQVYQGTITEKEAERAERAIAKYMDKYLRTRAGQTLSQGLNAATGEVSTFEQRLAIYQNWAKRPRKFKKVQNDNLEGLYTFMASVHGAQVVSISQFNPLLF